MKKGFFLSIRIIVHMLLLTIIFIWLIEFLQLPKIDKPSEHEFFSNSSIEEGNIKREAERLGALELLLMDEEIYQAVGQSRDRDTKTNSSLGIPNIKELKVYEYIFRNTNQVVPGIYVVMYFTILLQSLLWSTAKYRSAINKRFDHGKIERVEATILEFSINAPPILGVVGTVFSFGVVVVNLSEVSELSNAFRENFPNAALTTIVGGLVYVLNLLINIFASISRE